MNVFDRLLGKKTSEPVTWVETDELASLLSSASPPLVIDVRGPDEFTGPLGHIDSAQNIPLDQFPSHSVRLVGERRPLVLVCHTDRRSSAAADQLRRNGGTEIAVLRGGMVAWRSRSTE